MCNMHYDNNFKFNNIMEIIPNDSLFLGNGKNFNKGENIWLNTMLIPYPSMFFGAICSLMLSQNDSRKNKYIFYKEQNSNPQKYLRIGNIYLHNKNGDTYIPAPLDLYINDDERCRYSYANIRKIKNNIMCSSDSMKYLFFNNRKEENERCEGMFLKRSNFYNSYYNTMESLHVIKSCEIVNNSYKVGVEIGENATIKKGNLYRIDLTEFKKNQWSYLVEYDINNKWWLENIKPLDKGYLKLGGENKSCKFYSYKINEKLLDYSSKYDTKNKNEYVKMFFISPCIFKNCDWKPSFKDTIEVIAATTGKAHNLGGFDMVLKHPKPMYKAIPAGSVYLLKSNKFKDKLLKQIKETIIEKLDNHMIKHDLGFGQFEVIPLHELQMKGYDNEYER